MCCATGCATPTTPHRLRPNSMNCWTRSRPAPPAATTSTSRSGAAFSCAAGRNSIGTIHSVLLGEEQFICCKHVCCAFPCLPPSTHERQEPRRRAHTGQGQGRQRRGFGFVIPQKLQWH